MTDLFLKNMPNHITKADHIAELALSFSALELDKANTADSLEAEIIHLREALSIATRGFESIRIGIAFATDFTGAEGV